MSNKEIKSKELETLLTNAQRDVVKEVNTQRNFLAKIFSGDKSEALQNAQSSIAKAINLLAGLDSSDSQVASKLQQKLSDKDALIKELEEKLSASSTKTEELEGKVVFLERQVEKSATESKAAQVEAETKAPEQVAPSPSIDLSKLEEELSKLKEEKQDLGSRLKSSQVETKEARDLSTELNARLQRLKTELVAA